MEEEMAEVIVNEDEVEYTFTAYDVDLDYEFDAARFFDFSRPESPLEARQAEVWFDSAGTYPPSPFVVRLVSREEILMGSINISPRSKGVENMNLSDSDSDIEVKCGVSAPHMEYTDDGQDKRTNSTWKIVSTKNIENPFQNLPSGLSSYSHPLNNKNLQNHAKLSVKPSFPRASTLMKPTASQLAKQNRPIQPGYPRSNTSILEKIDKSSASTSGIENQAAKRRKLEGGLLWKAVGAVQLLQTNFVHKAPKREGLLDVNRIYAKPRITIPREPDLETAHRAQRTRPKGSKETENEMPTVYRYKARPLNKKILEAPSLLPKRSTPRLPDFLEFHLKTSERAMQHSSVSKSTVPSDNSVKALNNHATSLTERGWREPGRPAVMSTPRVDGGESSHTFKALPLNKKILTSKGDMGVFRNSKKETTVPMEFNFQTEKRSHLNPPIELFGKLSLASETQPIANSELKFPWSAGVAAKGSKENGWGHFQQTNEIKQPARAKLPLRGGKLHDNIDIKNEAGTDSGTKWSKGIR